MQRTLRGLNGIYTGRFVMAAATISLAMRYA